MLAVILARGGSKGLPGKNIKPLLGKPLIAYTIEQALASKYIERVVVSTDDPTIAEVSRSAGAEVPFQRPSELSTDQASSIEVVLHAVEFCETENEKKYEYVILLEPTSPLRIVSDIDMAFTTLLNNAQASAIVGITENPVFNPAFAFKKNQEGFLENTFSDFSSLRRQDVNTLYYPEGSLYISETSALKDKRSFYHDKTMGYLIPKWRSFEIDDLEDFLITEAIMQAVKDGRFSQMY